MLKNIRELSNTEIMSIVNNVNTGIEFEIAIYYHLNSNESRELIRNKIIKFHPFRDKIEEIILNFDTYTLKTELSLIKEPDATYLTTQDDTVGPSDIVLKIDEDLLGLSIKYSNNCNLNISGSHFLSKNSINDVKNQYKEFGERYIQEMNSLYGSVSNWFRQRKTSAVVDEFIDMIRDRVLHDWFNYLNMEKKTEIINLAFHNESPIRFYIARVDKKQGKYKCEINKNPIREMKIDKVELQKFLTSYVSFELDGKVFALMQIKFNNGILERPKGVKYDFMVDGVKMKFGSPLTSWNFNLK